MKLTNDEKFDAALALYHWLQQNWVGQTDPKYSAFCQLTAPGMFKPGCSQEYFESLDEEENENAKFIFDELTDQNYKDYLNQVLNYESEFENDNT